MKKFANKLDNNSLKNIAGGTVAETTELIDIYMEIGFWGKDEEGYSPEFFNKNSRIIRYIFKNNGIDAVLTDNALEKNSKPNTYINKKTGRHLTHKEAVEIFKNYLLSDE